MRGPTKDEFNACPRCQRPVEAVDYMNPAYLGFDALDPKITCGKCGYRGLPILLQRSDAEPTP